MATVGTISLTEATFAALLTDIVRSYKAHGFENIMMIGDSGGNGRGMTAVAKTLDDRVGREAARRAHPGALSVQHRQRAADVSWASPSPACRTTACTTIRASR